MPCRVCRLPVCARLFCAHGGGSLSGPARAHAAVQCSIAAATVAREACARLDGAQSGRPLAGWPVELAPCATIYCKKIGERSCQVDISPAYHLSRTLCRTATSSQLTCGTLWTLHRHAKAAKRRDGLHRKLFVLSERLPATAKSHRHKLKPSLVRQSLECPRRTPLTGRLLPLRARCSPQV